MHEECKGIKLAERGNAEEEDGTEMRGEGTPLRELWVPSPHLVWIRTVMTSHNGFLKFIDIDVNLLTGEQRRIAACLILLNRAGHIMMNTLTRRHMSH